MVMSLHSFMIMALHSDTAGILPDVVRVEYSNNVTVSDSGRRLFVTFSELTCTCTSLRSAALWVFLLQIKYIVLYIIIRLSESSKVLEEQLIRSSLSII
jgi:hypothetical protein